MDGFMDKLSKRFNAGELIKANNQAEARDLKRTREEVRKYEEMMQEIRRLHLKNAEITDQVQQLTQVGIERLEEYHTPKIAETYEQILSETKKNSEAIERLSQLSAQMDEILKTQNGELGGRITGQLEELNTRIGTQMEAMNDRMAGQVDGMSGRLDEMSARISEIGNRPGQDEEQLRSAVALVTGNTTSQLRQTSSALEEKLEETKAAVLQQNAAKIDGVAADLKRELTDHVHKENVKVYRNVQAVVTDESARKFGELNARLDQLEGRVKKSGINALLVLTCIFTLASLVLQVLQMLELLPF